MEPLAVPDTAGAETFTDAQGFIANYACELGLSAAECSPAHFDDSLELLGGLRDLGDVICWSDNIDRCISYLNKELVALGLPALYKDAGAEDGLEHGFDLLALVNSTCRLLNLYQGVCAKLSDMEVEEMQRARELDYLRTRQGKLKNQVEACEREIAAVQNKEQQLQNSNKRLNSMLKEEKDEITKLLSTVASQKNQHTHEMKRKEQELFRLKEKLSQLVTDKRDRRGTIDILNALPRADGKRATWKTGKSLGRKEEELYRIQLAKQERREQGLALENAKLKQLLNKVGQDVEQLLGTDVGLAQGTEQSCPYDTFEEQWCRLSSHIKSLSSQAVDAVSSQMYEGDGQDPVISVTDHDKEILKLRREIEDSRALIMLQQQCFQEQMTAAADSELPLQLKGSYFLEEQQRLQEERAMFREQKRAFEIERENFTEAAIRLGWERKQFEEQKALFLKQEFFCSLPRLDTSDPKRRFSAPVAVREEQEHEDSPKLKRWAKPICTPYPKVIITPCHIPTERFRRRWLASNHSSPTTCRQQALLPNHWSAPPQQLSQNKENHQETASQTEMPVKDSLHGDLSDHFLDSCL